ncbi:Protein of unknown function [Noviherbaspirillum humi]|uniref:DUF3619 domain-containing protein n=1 Tax=Noviherbaspirillum humi TaxID=1688639 RepID=A0A239KRN4_9BURK|nr:DUF3619 family protein [Noviherbaspirillum humi]SNT21016.1 Protein of unknown function [Noviherbaspirillum humi]
MNNRELNFAYKIRHALNETLDDMPEASLQRLATARKAALARRKKESRLSMLVPQRLFAGNAGQVFGSSFSWISRIGVALPMVALVTGLIGIYEVEQKHRINETAEIDAAVLSDELPLSAYTDHGFNAFLATRGE